MKSLLCSKKFNSLIFFVAVAVVGCGGIPAVKYNQLQMTEELELQNQKGKDIDYLINLIASVKGLQYGDQIFKRSTAAYWVIPEIEKVDLEIVARNEGLANSEYNSRLKEILSHHREFLSFTLDLKMPFYAKWTTVQLRYFMQKNLVVTLENGTKTIFSPERLLLQFNELFYESHLSSLEKEESKDLEVRLPVRLHFKRDSEAGSILTRSVNKIVLKVVLKEEPPFQVSLYTDKGYQAFRWRIAH